MYPKNGTAHKMRGKGTTFFRNMQDKKCTYPIFLPFWQSFRVFFMLIGAKTSTEEAVVPANHPHNVYVLGRNGIRNARSPILRHGACR